MVVLSLFTYYIYQQHHLPCSCLESIIVISRRLTDKGAFANGGSCVHFVKCHGGKKSERKRQSCWKQRTIKTERKHFLSDGFVLTDTLNYCSVYAGELKLLISCTGQKESINEPYYHDKINHAFIAGETITHSALHFLQRLFCRIFSSLSFFFREMVSVRKSGAGLTDLLL